MEYIVEKDRIFSEDADGKILAEITFPTKNGVSTINHTFVDDSLRGKGVASLLVKLAIDQIKMQGNRVAATCPYAKLWLQRHRE